MIILARILLVLALLVPGIANAQFTDQRTWAPTTGGSANAQTVAIANVSGPPLGVVFRAKAAAANTGALTLNVNSTGAKNVTKPSAAGPVALTGGELQVGQIFEFMYDGTNYQLVSNLNAAAAQVISPPQGYLTPCPQAIGATQPTGCTAGTILPTGDTTIGSGQTVTGLVYTPVNGGNSAPVWNGTQFVNITFQELTLTVPSSRLANTIYDVCVFNNGGSLAIGFTPAWTTSTAGSGNRGTGAGTPQIERKNGIYVNSVSMSVVNGGTTTPVAANQCTYVGSVLIDGTNGVISFHRAPGQNRKWGAWNAYNRLQLELKVTDNTPNWNYTIQTWRAANGSSSNSLTVFSGLSEEIFSITSSESMTSTAGAHVFVGIGYNSTTTPSGKWGAVFAQASGFQDVATSSYDAPPALGINVATALEESQAANITTWYGTEQWFLMTAKWRG